MNKSKIAGIMAKLNAVDNQLVEDVAYVRSRDFPNQRFDHQQGYKGSYGNGQTSYSQNSQFQQPLQNNNSFSFTRNFDLASYQDLTAPIPRWNESSLTTSWHAASMESGYEFMKDDESDEFDVAKVVSTDTSLGCDEAKSSRLDTDL
ncbi:T32E20.11 [Arabidopsis thaliana]|uniref:T32E20.11 n=1 Tax=Arabidopsis thaliana TaxID=3702 RepID=Q9LPA9_ARATH|nr:T32E20.11 [Arabidopsis thaliana]